MELQMNVSCAERCLAPGQHSGTSPIHLQESVGFFRSRNDLCLPERHEHWNSHQIFHKMIKSSARESAAAAARLQQSSPRCPVSNDLATLLVLVFFGFFLNQHVSKDSRGVPVFPQDSLLEDFSWLRQRPEVIFQRRCQHF